MARRSRAASQAAAVYAQRVARVQPFVTRRFPSYGKSTPDTRRALLNAYKALWGWTPKRDAQGRLRGEDVRPLLSSHTSVVRFVTSATEAERAKKDARRFQAALDDLYQERLTSWERSPNKGRTPPPRPSVDIQIRRAKSARVAEQAKADIGQETPRDVRAVFIKKDPVPGEPELWHQGDLIRLADRFISVTGFHIVVFRPIDPRRWVADPTAEEARVMAQLRADFTVISAHEKKRTGKGIPEKSAIFAPQTGNHRYYDPGLKEEERVHNLLAFWRQQYGVQEAQREGRGAVARWLVGINLIIYRAHAQGVQQFGEDYQRQTKRRIQRKKVDRFIQAARSKRAKPKAKPLRRKRRR